MHYCSSQVLVLMVVTMVIMVVSTCTMVRMVVRVTAGFAAPLHERLVVLRVGAFRTFVTTRGAVRVIMTMVV